MLDESLVFHKTERGASEAASPVAGLAPRLRRCLELVDGHKTVGELAAHCRPGEAGAILRELADAGYITPQGGAGLRLVDSSANR